ncbi:MAG: acyl-CoA-binding protein [Actinobacteria bacterium]|jgi:acyl-CoA-binding protein|nr:acyl-CoA-binding protein [Actinomycetota bacterium]
MTFDDAVAAAATLTRDPGNATKLALYALYKQATEGDCTGKRPGFTNPVGRAKHDAWASVEGTSQDEAKAEYAERVAELLAAEQA